VDIITLFLVALGLACVVSAIIGGGLRITGWIEIPAISSFRRQIFLGLFGAVVAAVGFSQYSGSDGAPEARRAPSLSPPHSINHAPIKIDRVYAEVPRCATFGGQGVAPANKTLWLAVLGPNSKYYFSGPVNVNVDRSSWILRKLNIGRQGTPPGTHFTIYAVLVDNATNGLLQENRSVGFPTLPDKSHEVDHVEVVRSSDSTVCR
jgi:hypothetical protein